jgi:hypothetical protein
MLAIISSGPEIVQELLTVFAGQKQKVGDPTSLRKHWRPKIRRRQRSVPALLLRTVQTGDGLPYGLSAIVLDLVVVL